MTIKITIGKGKGKRFSFSVLPIEATLTNEHKKKTIEQLAKQLLKQAKIKDGEIKIYGVEFRAYKRKEEGSQ